MGSLSLLQRIFPTQELNQDLPCCRFFTIREALRGVKNCCCIRLVRIKDYCLPTQALTTHQHLLSMTDLPVCGLSRPLSGSRSKSWVDLPPSTLMLTPALSNCCVLMAVSSLPDTPFLRLNEEPENQQQGRFQVGRRSAAVVRTGKAVKGRLLHIPRFTNAIRVQLRH